jgi:outer membrane lipoprotein-sorting protein
MKRLFSIIILSIFTLTLSAQTTIDTDQGASKILDNVLKKYNSYGTMSIDFSFKSEKNKVVIMTTKGKLLIKGKKYYATFNEQVYGCDSLMVWNYQKEGNEANLYEFDETEAPIFHPTKFIANWKNEFKVKFIREEFTNNISTQILDLIPIKQTNYYKIRIFIDKNKKEIIKTQIFDKNNTIYNYFITKMVANTPIQDATFKFNKNNYPNVQINDMR